MAISHVQPVLLLLATLFFFLSALRGAIIDFKYCGDLGNEFCNITRMEISPSVGPGYSQGSTLNVYAYARKNFPAGTLVELTRSHDNVTIDSPIETYNICDVVACNLDAEVETGTNFVLTFADLYADNEDDDIHIISMKRKYDYPLLVCVLFKVRNLASVYAK